MISKFSASRVTDQTRPKTIRTSGAVAEGFQPRLAASSLLLAGLLSIALLLRLYRLDAGLWLDEILSYVSYFRLPLRQIASTYDSQNQHLLYSLLARASLVIFGDHGWAVRLPAVIFGVASILALYLLACEVADRREALLSAALLTFSYHHVWFSQNARGYTGMLFATLLTGWLLLLGLKQSRLRIWAGYALAAALGVYVHLTMLFVVGGQVLTYLYAVMRDWRGLGSRAVRIVVPLAGFAVAGLLILLLYAPVLPQLVAGQAAVGKVSMVNSVWKNPLWTLLELARGLRIGFASVAVAAIAAVLALVGAWSYARKNPVFLTLLVFPVALGLVAIVGMHYHVWPRFFFFAIGFGAMLLVRGVFVIGELCSRRLSLAEASIARIQTALALALILASATSIPAAYGPKQDYEGALAFVTAQVQAGDRIVVAGLAAMPYRDYYHLDWPEVSSQASVEAARSGARRTWLLYTLPIHFRANYPDLVATIDRDFRVVKQFPGTLNGGEVVVCLSDSAETAPQVSNR
jgi:mannosyltransferase